jgi:hypothetical protein
MAKTIALIIALLVAVLAFGSTGGTYAAYSDYANLDHNRASAAVWEDAPPAACGPVSQYAGVVYDSVVGAVIHADADTIVIVSGGDATIYAAAHVCIVVTLGGNKILDLDLTAKLVLGIGTNSCSSSLIGLIACTLWQTLHLLGAATKVDSQPAGDQRVVAPVVAPQPTGSLSTAVGPPPASSPSTGTSSDPSSGDADPPGGSPSQPDGPAEPGTPPSTPASSSASPSDPSPSSPSRSNPVPTGAAASTATDEQP